MALKLRIYSDIHLDHYNSLSSMWYPPTLPDDKDTILLLAGDLWVGSKWIEHGAYSDFSWIGMIAPRFKQVLIVLGNHDYWPHGDLTILHGAEKCNIMLQDRGYYNVKVLDCSTWEHEDVVFVGATLWTDMNRYDPFTMYQMGQVMAYDGKIKYETGSGYRVKFTSEKWINTHTKHRDYIDVVARQNPEKRVVVITHHVPLNNLKDPNFPPSFQDGYYTSDLSEIILDNQNIKFWMYGHTHHQSTFELGACTLINNCVGYQGEHNEQEGLVKHEVLEL